MNTPSPESAASVDAFIARLPAAAAAACRRVLEVAMDLAPDAEQGTSYGVPALRLHGKPLIGMNAAKSHLSIFPFSPTALDTVRATLGEWDLAKGTIRFTPENPVPDDSLAALIRARMGEIEPGSGPSVPNH